MEFFTSIVGAGANAMSGGIFGLVGSLFGGVFKYFQRKQDQSFKKEEWNHELELQESNRKSAQLQTDNELEIVAQAGSYKGLNASIRAQGKVPESYTIVNAIRSLFRPFLTTGLVVLTAFFYHYTQDEDLREYIIQSMVFCASTSIVWWFGDRAFAPPGMKNK